MHIDGRSLNIYREGLLAMVRAGADDIDGVIVVCRPDGRDGALPGFWFSTKANP